MFLKILLKTEERQEKNKITFGSVGVGFSKEHKRERCLIKEEDILMEAQIFPESQFI